MANIAKTLLIALCVLILLSCTENANNQDTTMPQAQEPVAVTGNDVEQETDNHENVQIPVVIPELTNLTLIPSVEPSQLRNVMPNSWHRLERLTEAEEQAFISENINALLEIERANVNFGWFEFFFYSIYREQVGEDIFYRVITTAENPPDFISQAIQFNQSILHQNRILISSSYKTSTPTQGGHLVLHEV